MELECSSLHSALESAKSHVRALHRGVERDAPAVVKAASKLLISPDYTQPQAVLQSLEQVELLLQQHDDKFIATCAQVQRRVKELQARLQIIASDSAADDRTSQDARLLRFIIDYLLREGKIDIAQRVADEAGLQLLCDSDLHRMLASVCNALEQQHDCTEALLFCAEHRASLAKISSSLEVELRIQQMVQLMRDDNYPAAIQFARAKLAPFLASFPHLVQQAMMLLALRSNTLMEPYRRFFSDGRWSFLAATFTSEAYRVFRVAECSALQASMLIGLTAAKTCVCGSADFAVADCPACSPLFAAVVHLLPQGPRQHTALICPWQHCLMDDHNPPLALPSGRYVTHLQFVFLSALTCAFVASHATVRCSVISTSAADHMLLTLGHIECPTSGQVYSMSELKRCYIS